MIEEPSSSQDMLLQTCCMHQKTTRWEVHHSVSLNPMRVKAVLTVVGQLSIIHLLEVFWSHNRQYVILITYWLSSECKQSTKKYDFFMVEKVGWFQKRLPNSRKYCKIDDIMALHSPKFDGHKIVLRYLTCSQSAQLMLFAMIAKYWKKLT